MTHLMITSLNEQNYRPNCGCMSKNTCKLMPEDYDVFKPPFDSEQPRDRQEHEFCDMPSMKILSG